MIMKMVPGFVRGSTPWRVDRYAIATRTANHKPKVEGFRVCRLRWSEVSDLPRAARELVAKLRVRDRDQPARALADARPPQLGNAVLGHYTVDDVLQSRHGGPRVQAWDDPRDRFVVRRRVEHDERLAARRHDRAAREVRLTTRRRPVVAAERLGRALPEKSTSSVALIVTMPSSRAMAQGSFVWLTGQNSTPGFSSTNSYSRRVPNALVVMILFLCVCFRDPLMTPFSTSSTKPSHKSSV